MGITVGMLLFENFPFKVAGVGLFAHFIYMTLLRTFPLCTFTSIAFIGSVRMSIIIYIGRVTRGGKYD